MRTPAILTAVLLLAGCGEKGGDTNEETGDDTFDDTDIAEAIWSEIAGYSSWSQPPGWEGVVASADGTHGPYVRIWANAAAADTLAAGGKAPMPAGATFVEEGYDDEAGGSARGVTVMKKITNYNASAGDWFWASYSPSGEVATAGKVNLCIDCHGAGQDYVLSVTW